MSERRCETCEHWRPPVSGCARWCVALHHHTGPADRCDHYDESDVPFADDATGSDAELDAKGASDE